MFTGTDHMVQYSATVAKGSHPQRNPSQVQKKIMVSFGDISEDNLIKMFK